MKRGFGKMKNTKMSVQKIWLLPALAACLHAAPIRLTCEYLTNPLGIDSAAPRLSWQNDSTERN